MVISVIQIVYLKTYVITDVSFIVLIIDNLWIVGDSLIHWVAHYLLPWGETAINLHLPKRRVTWKGFRGGHLSDVPFIIQQSINRYNGTWNWHAPVVVILHMGGNDLTQLDIVRFKRTLELVVYECRRMLPNTFLIWSDILPRFSYRGACSQKAIERKRKDLNKMARALILAHEGRVIKHPTFLWNSRNLFSADGVHLGRLGQKLFTGNLRKGLHFFRKNPEALVYPAC